MLYNWLKDTNFAYPMVLALFALLPLLIFWYVKKYNHSQSSFKVSTTLAFNVSSWKNRFRHLPFVLRLLAVSALILTIARPQKRFDEQRTEGEGIDIVLCIDVSGSMGTTDIHPSRMQVAKDVAIDFVKSRPVDRIGLVIFSGEAFTQTPITTNRDVLISSIEALESRKHLDDGTVIGEGLATAADRLSKTESKSKVIILLTDGKEDPPETRLIDPLTALEIAKAKAVKVYAIGMGAMPSTIVERSDSRPGQKNVSIDFIDVALLQKIASETGGQYFRATDREGLKNIYKQIDELEKTKVEVITTKRYEERFLPFVLAALCFLAIELILRFTLFRKFP